MKQSKKVSDDAISHKPWPRLPDFPKKESSGNLEIVFELSCWKILHITPNQNSTDDHTVVWFG